ncbi:hypothetical protein [Amycolatopsis anabasis]|uniref:hypothetical protein n=1 Tax=Amycolatopsis anabasis TaxID=1840409 RepID=UPI001FE86731|nr:hypothetical protein [Amycolatopsis anabasis]
MNRALTQRSWLTAAALAVVAAVLYAVARGHLIDDSFITFSYARNLAFHGHWGLVADAPSNTATSPGNVLALAALTVITRDVQLAAGALFATCQVVAYFALRRIGASLELPRWFPPLTVAALMVNPLLISSIGLEVAMGATGLCWLLALSLDRRPFALGLTIGAVVLIRVDLLLFAVVLVLVRKRFWQGLVRCTLGALAVVVPWFGFSWLVLGGVVPDTLVIKTLQGAQKAWGDWDFSNGPLLYFQNFPWQTALAFAPPLLAAAVADARSRFPLGMFAFAGVAHYTVYSALGVPPYHWYYAPMIIAGTVFACAHAKPAVLGLLVVSAVTYVATPREFAPITSNYASTAEYARIGRDLSALAEGRAIASHGEIGVLAYYCDCAIVDTFSDRGRLAVAVRERLAHASPTERALYTVNFAFADEQTTPRRVDLELVRASAPPPNTVARWDIHAPTLGPDHLYLRRVP